MSFPLVLHALREPERFAEEWTRDRVAPLSLLASFAVTASVGVGAYGAAMHLHDGVIAAALGGGAAISAAGAAWSATVPSLYVLGTLNGSRLSLPSVLLATLVTVSFGGLAMLASVPVLWFFELCIPHDHMRVLVSLVVFAGVGVSMADVFFRVMARIEGGRFRHLAWLGLLSVVGVEMFYLFGLFTF